MVILVGSIYLVYVLLKLYISVMQIGFINKAKYGAPFLLKASEFIKAGNYSVAKEKKALLETVLEYALFVFWLSTGLMWLESAIVVDSALLKGVLYVLAFIAINSLVALPFEIYEKFKLNEEYGFNKMSFKLFVLDTLKSTILLIVFGGTVVAAIIAIVSNFSLWWLWAFLFVFGVILLINMIYPTIIAPMFNKMSLLEDESLRDKIEELMAKVGFKSSGIFVMDASKRDSRLNAYFGGFGKSKRVVLFDTLIEKLESVELIAVLGHELGHFKHGDIFKNIALMGTMLFVMFAIFGNIPQSFFEAFELLQTPYELIVLFLLFSPVLSFVMMPIMGFVSRNNEFAADRVAVELSSGAIYLSEALKKLVTENRSFPFSHPLYILFYYTHPPVSQRLKELGVEIDNSSKDAVRDEWKDEL